MVGYLLLLLTVPTVRPSGPPVARSLARETITWKIDTVHSDVSFKIRHFVSKVHGGFLSWGGTIQADPKNLSGGSVEVTIQTASVNTRMTVRDNDLRSERFFDAANFPTITFKSKKVDVTGNTMKVTGDLTIRGVTKEVVLEGEFGGVVGEAAAGKQRIGFTASTKVNRMDYGVKWNRAVEGGGVMLGDEVQIDLNIEAVRQ